MPRSYDRLVKWCAERSPHPTTVHVKAIAIRGSVEFSSANGLAPCAGGDRKDGGEPLSLFEINELGEKCRRDPPRWYFAPQRAPVLAELRVDITDVECRGMFRGLEAL